MGWHRQPGNFKPVAQHIIGSYRIACIQGKQWLHAEGIVFWVMNFFGVLLSQAIQQLLSLRHELRAARKISASPRLNTFQLR